MNEKELKAAEALLNKTQNAETSDDATKYATAYQAVTQGYFNRMLAEEANKRAK